MKAIKINKELCTGCKKCEEVCSKTFFRNESRNMSVIKVTASRDNSFDINVCSQCGKCTHICPTQALHTLASGVIALNKSKCVQCFACVGFCDTLSIHYFKGITYPCKCTACGRCVQNCETGAITI